MLIRNVWLFSFKGKRISAAENSLYSHVLMEEQTFTAIFNRYKCFTAHTSILLHLLTPFVFP